MASIQVTTNSDSTIQVTRDRVRDLAPAGAHGAIVAELHQDVSDSQSDYFSHRTTRRVVIGWRMTQRESFPAMRKAAGKFAPTRHLVRGDRWELFPLWGSKDPATWTYEERVEAASRMVVVIGTEDDRENAIESLEMSGMTVRVGVERFEHRENYSMGGGNYLKDGHRDANGWAVRTTRFEHLPNELEILEHLVAAGHK